MACPTGLTAMSRSNPMPRPLGYIRHLQSILAPLVGNGAWSTSKKTSWLSVRGEYPQPSGGNPPSYVPNIASILSQKCFNYLYLTAEKRVIGMLSYNLKVVGLILVVRNANI